MSTWQERSTAPGVMFATDFGTDEEVLPYRSANAPDPPTEDNPSGGPIWQDRISRVVRMTDSDGSPFLRINVVAAKVGEIDYQGQTYVRRLRPWSEWPNDTDGIGTTPVEMQFGLRIPPSRLIPWAPGKGTWKFLILANKAARFGPDQSSNQLSHVLTNRWTKGNNFPIAYAHNNIQTNGAPFEGVASWNPSGDYNLSPGWDRGPSFTDPVTRYCAYSNTVGCPIWLVGVWIKFRFRVHIRTYNGTAGNELDFWWALPGDTNWTLLATARDYLAGEANWQWPNGFNALWLTPYETDRNDPWNPGVDSYLDYKQLIVSTQEIAFPTDAPGTQPQEEPMATFIVEKDSADTVEVLDAAVYDALVAKAAQVQPLTDQLADANSKLAAADDKIAAARIKTQAALDALA